MSNVRIKYLVSMAGAVMISAGEEADVTPEQAASLAAVGYAEILQPGGGAAAEKREKAVKTEKKEQG